MFGLGGLKLLVKGNIESFEEKISIFNLLDIAKEAYQKLFDDKIWFTDHLTKKFKIVFNTDRTRQTVGLGRVGVESYFPTPRL